MDCNKLKIHSGLILNWYQIRLDWVGFNKCLELVSDSFRLTFKGTCGLRRFDKYFGLLWNWLSIGYMDWISLKMFHWLIEDLFGLKHKWIFCQKFRNPKNVLNFVWIKSVEDQLDLNWIDSNSGWSKPIFKYKWIRIIPISDSFKLIGLKIRFR